MDIQKYLKPKIVLPVLSIGGLIARIVWPDIKIDSITIGLLLTAALPWLPDYIRRAKLPGGWEIDFRDLDKAADKVTKGRADSGQSSSHSFLEIAEQDPNLGLVGLRIEIEKRIRTLAKQQDLTGEKGRSLSYIIAKLRADRIIDVESETGLSELIMAGNHAAHGAIVDMDAARWAVNRGPEILAVLDEKISEKRIK